MPSEVQRGKWNIPWVDGIFTWKEIPIVPEKLIYWMHDLDRKKVSSRSQRKKLHILLRIHQEFHLIPFTLIEKSNLG
jgi:hypothetical protein